MNKLHKLLRDATHSIHTRVERERILKNYLSAELTVQQYQRIALQHWLAYSTWQQQLNRLQPQAAAVPINRIHLHADLLKRELNQHTMQTCHDKPPRLAVETEADYLGCAYVFEGSKLGAKLIYKSLKRNKHFNDFTFFFYRQLSENLSDTLSWPSWIKHVETYASTHGISQQAIAHGAINCFKSIHHWFKCFRVT